MIALLTAFILTLTLTTAHAADATTQALGSIFKSFSAAGQISSSHFQVRGCTIPVQKWAPYLIGGTLKHHFKFTTDCDLEGDLAMTHTPFPIDLAVRNLSDFKKVHATVEVTPGLDFEQRQATVTVVASEAKLTDAGGQTTEFHSDYRCLVGLDGRIVGSRAASKGSGGTLHVTRLRGKAVSIDTPIKYP